MRFWGKRLIGFLIFFDVTERGNWEGKNILRIKDPKNLPSEAGRAGMEEKANGPAKPADPPFVG